MMSMPRSSAGMSFMFQAEDCRFAYEVSSARWSHCRRTAGGSEPPESSGKMIVVLLADTAERYVSGSLFDPSAQ
jgi:hypothetical protein